ncbi:preprotein translocase subunit YajC [Pseudonocardia sp. KRD291]|uniref:preprotein translocase subunit YajC n=1 Tax=Pseudonocardia sp. KRD291 TaxID=2792007 RepID=UPI001C4A1DD9|nr:preprotein translocase subunit YajC [Pseudonocardia sp. KRD291]MBW0106777.1 preprotein translocase subunit YajC [Pseudonocardia sp. KRD291]
MSLLPFLIILLLFVPLFLNGRKQRRQMAQTQSMQAALETGDVVITTSGLRGTITDDSYEDTVDLEIAEGVVTTWLRAAVREKVDPDAGHGAVAVEEDPADTDDEATPSSSESPKVTPSESKPIIH